MELALWPRNGSRLTHWLSAGDGRRRQDHSFIHLSLCLTREVSLELFVTVASYGIPLVRKEMHILFSWIWRNFAPSLKWVICRCPKCPIGPKLFGKSSSPPPPMPLHSHQTLSDDRTAEFQNQTVRKLPVDVVITEC